MIEEPDDPIIKRYLLVITRRHRPYTQLLWAEDLHETKDAIVQLQVDDYDILHVRAFKRTALHTTGHYTPVKSLR